MKATPLHKQAAFPFSVSSLISSHIFAMTSDADHFSELPHDLVIIIISFLPFLDAYRLCMSRKKWYKLSLWLYCPSFELHEASFMCPDDRLFWLNLGKRTLTMNMKREGKLRYFHFVNQAVPKLASKVLKKFNFRFYYSSNRYHQPIDKWIKTVLSKEVQELSLDFSDGDPIEPQPIHSVPQYVLPHFFYEEGMSIRILNINSCGLGYCNFGNFLMLTKLSLTRVRLFMEEIEHIVLSCPLLETLSLVECFRLVKVEITFFMLRLNKLIVRHCEPLTLGVELWLPMLQYFEYAGKMVPMDTKGMLDLDEVILDYYLDVCYPYHAQDVRSLFNCFDDARIIKVSTSTLKVLPPEYLLYRQPLFQLRKLVHLILKTGMEHCELAAIICLLGCSPFLKTLFILTGEIMHIHDFRPNYFPIYPGEIWTVDDWILEHLKSVQMEGFTGKRCEVDLLLFILRNARSLQKLNVKQLIRATSSVTSEAFKEIKKAAVASEADVINWS